MKTFISFLISLAICLLFFLMLDFALMKTQGLQLIPDKKVAGEEKAGH